MHSGKSRNVQSKQRQRHKRLRTAAIVWIYASSLLLLQRAGTAEGFTAIRCQATLSASREPEVSVSSITTQTEEDGVSLLKTSKSNSIRLAEASSSNEYSDLPIWLRGYSAVTSDHEVDSEVTWLEYKMLEQGIHIEDIRTVVRDIYKVSEGDNSLSVGIVDFLTTILSLKEYDNGNVHFVSVPVLRASILHYAECVAARREGIPTLLEEFLRQPRGDNLALPAPLRSQEPEQSVAQCTPFDSVLPSADSESTIQAQEIKASLEEAAMISKGAARIKRAEMLAQAISKDNRAAGAESAEKLRDLLLSLTEDWRALAIRVVACLYRLEGLLKSSKSRIEYLERTPEVVRTAREALQLYAPLAQRLGLHDLKARIEACAFQILYRRQYEAATSIFRDVGGAMNALSGYLLSHISRTLRLNEKLMAELDDLQVYARVKEPYSFWRKLLKKRLKGTRPLALKSAEQTGCSALSFPQVNDGVALRVVLKAKKNDPTESDDVTRSREAVLCYYVQELIRRHWPETDPARLKDYIAEPKPNGYQSLHHTSKITRKGEEYPFEVQVRSEDMHRLAEYGYAAHWDYKLGSNKFPPTENVAATDTLVPEVRRKANSHIDALEWAKEALTNQKVHIFVVGGENVGVTSELVTVPVDSSIDSAITDIKTTFPAKVQVWRNGKFADKAERLENGDVVMIAL